MVCSDSGEEDEEGMERRRAIMRERARKKAMEEDLLDVQEEEESESEEVGHVTNYTSHCMCHVTSCDITCIMSLQSSEYEEYSDSEDEMGPRLKPVFVRK